MPLEPLDEKFKSFGFHVIEIDGHNMREIVDACSEAKAIFEKPTCIIAHTIAGKGIPFMEFKYQWHGKIPNKDEAAQAHEYLKQVRTMDGRITGEHQ
jgi:transketolase